MNALRLMAPAKVNLDLRILGRRQDGYHILETVFHGLDLHDQLFARLVPSGLHLDMPSRVETGMTVQAGENNLVLRAARRFLDASGCEGGLHYCLLKKIPAGAGLGGGSSDAAAALILANALHGQPLSRAELDELASGLGADVRYFLSAGTQLGEGLGDQLSPIANPGCADFLLIFPPFGCSTVEVYKNYKPKLNTDLPSFRMRCGEGVSPVEKALAGEFGNDLESSAMNLYPELAEIRQSIEAMGFPQVTMSGSGSTLFLMFPASGGSVSEEGRLAMKTLEHLAGRGLQFVLTRSASEAVSRRIPSQAIWPFDDHDVG